MTLTATADRWVLALPVNSGSTASIQATEAVRKLCDTVAASAGPGSGDKE